MKKILLAALLLTAILMACEESIPGPAPSENFDAIIAEGGSFESVSKSEKVLDSSESYHVEDGEEYLCTTETLKVEEAAGGNSGFPLFNPNSSVVYPGSLLQGNSLNQATPNIIAVKRSGGTISTDVFDGSIAPSFEVDEVKISSITEAANSIIRNSSGVVPANFEFSYDLIQSKREMALKMKAEYETKFTELEGKLEFSSDRSYNRMLITLNQSFYTLRFDIPTSTDQIFAPEVTPQDLERYVGPGNPAAYVSSVTYGRIYYMLIETTSSKTELEASVTASFSGLTTGGSGQVDYRKLEELNNIKVRVFAFGGEAGSTLRTIGETDLSQIVDLLAESTDITTGKAVSYVVRSVYDNQIVSVKLNTEYDVTNCTPTGNVGVPPYTAHWAGLASSFGGIGAAYSTSGTEFILINKEGTEYLISNTGTLDGPYPISQLGDGNVPFTKIGAACNINGNKHNSQTLMVFDETGTQFTYMLDNGRWLNIEPITNLANGNCPFNLTGVGAMMFYTKDSQGPSTRYMFDGNGINSTYYKNNPEGFSYTRNIKSYWRVNNISFPFEEVGASIGFYIGNERFQLFFNGAGDKYLIRGNTNGTGSQFLGPFSL